MTATSGTSAKEARDALIQANLPLVASLCSRMCWHGADYEDLYQQGCIGLMLAAERYDASRGAFSTFAVPYMMGEMRACCHASSAVRVPRSERAFRAKLRRAEEMLTASLHREPTLPELASALSLEPTELAQRMDVITVISMDASPSDDDDITLQDRFADDDPWLERLMLCDLLDRLPEDEHTLYLLRFQQHLTQHQTARRMALTQPQVCRMEAALRRKLAAAWFSA